MLAFRMYAVPLEVKLIALEYKVDEEAEFFSGLSNFSFLLHLNSPLTNSIKKFSLQILDFLCGMIFAFQRLQPSRRPCHINCNGMSVSA